MTIRIRGALALLMLSLWCDVSSAVAGDDSEYNFSWLDPDKKVYVLQNRRYRKAGDAQVFALGGLSVSDPYRSVIQVQPRLGYWFSEDLGIEAFFSARFHSPNNAYLALEEAINLGGSTKSPNIREIRSQTGILLNWAPWYAKINVFNSVLYFDWYLSAGAGLLGTEIGPKSKDDVASAPLWRSENLFAVFLGTGHLFHFNERWLVRLDLLGSFYSAEIYSGIAGAPADRAIFSNFAFNAGIGYQL
ncbi:MAG: outer membrane beta-barrel domain-containing protein [Proteobacteria bacterium]|nr:outer membrane beta-barrel domain-containing protein [Pseudomonadota bacterium]